MKVDSSPDSYIGSVAGGPQRTSEKPAASAELAAAAGTAAAKPQGVTVKVFGPAWVIKRPVGAGATLTQDDAELAEVDWAASPVTVLARPEMWVGQQTAFALTPGQPIRQNMVRPTRAFAAGDQVRVNSSGSGFSISATGLALTAGLVGQSARGRLPGGRVVTGLVQEDQTVEMAL